MGTLTTSNPSNRSRSPGVGRNLVFWQTAQVIGIVATVVLLIGLIAVPERTLTIFWNAVIPLLPATFLVTPALWRNVCPLATLNMALDRFRFSAPKKLKAEFLGATTVASVALLVLLVPARRFLFNSNGPALAVVIIVVALAALMLGAVFQRKSGFCNSVCPVLPVERLYGQRPFVRITNPRCRPCLKCTATGCIDNAPTKSVGLTLGRTRKSHAWLGTPFGVFAGAFPGFIIGYFMTDNTPLSAATSVYLNVAAWAAGSYAFTHLVVRVFRIPAVRATILLGAASAALYYWFAAPVIVTEFGLPGPAAPAIRLASLLLVTIWLLRNPAAKAARTSTFHQAVPDVTDGEK